MCLYAVSISTVCFAEEILSVNIQEKGAEISPSMYGIFFEEINRAGDGGLYAELVQNRSFEELEMPEGYYAKNDKLYPKPVQNHVTKKPKSRLLDGQLILF